MPRTAPREGSPSKPISAPNKRTLGPWGALVLASLALAGCIGKIGDTGPGSAAEGPGAGANSKVAEPAPLARLTSLQYENTIRDLFAPIPVAVDSPPTDPVVEGFDNNTGAQTPSAAHIEAYHAGASAAARAVMEDPSTVAGCSLASRPDEDACAEQVLTRLGERAYRRPLAADELTGFLGFYDATRSDGTDFITATTLALQAMLESPRFLYRVEEGVPIAGQDGVVQLTSYEMASRLSYLLWNTMPDDELFAAAGAGDLDTPEGIEVQARRMLDDPRAREAILRFHSQWLRFDKMAVMTKDAAMFPAFGPETAAALQRSAELYVEEIFFGGGSLDTLLTDHNAFVNDEIAWIYGVPAPGSDEMQWVPVDPTQRAGILTNAGLLASFAHETADSPVLRGMLVLDRFMCVPPPPPPKGVDTTPPEANDGTPMTTRERFATQHEQGSCAGCHQAIHGVGFGFSSYDAVGQWRTTENGLAVDPSGWFTPNAATDLEGDFVGAVELAERLASSRAVQACLVSQWLRYALGVDRTGVDATQVEPILQAFIASDKNLKELVVELTRSPAFRTHRTASAAEVSP